MKANTVSLINALTLIIFGSWGYIDSGMEAFTALIPVFVGIILVVVNKGVQKENKIAAHVAVLLTFLILIGLLRPFFGSLERNDTSATLRVSLMIISTIFAMISFIKSFIAARKLRKSK
tara:strand:- start:81 stop:437 length:357 start_codon:yes stop_codon:yes gene_type:complete